MVATRLPHVWVPAATAGAAPLALAHGLGQGWSPGVAVFAAAWLGLAAAVGAGLHLARRLLGASSALTQR